MSKNYYTSRHTNGAAKAETAIERPFIFTEDGRKVHVRAISMVEMEEAERGLEKHFRAQNEPLDPPTYVVSVAGGGEVPYPLTADILETSDPVETARRKEAWAAHVEAVNRFNAEKGRLIQEIILEGVDVDVPEDGVWEARMKRRYIEVPDDPVLKRQKYLLTEILKTPDDWLNVQNEILILSSSGAIKREVVEAASATFRSQLFAVAEGPDEESAPGRNGGAGAQETTATLGALGQTV